MIVTKDKFLNKLAESICKLPGSEIDKTLTYYSEIIDDLVESGLSEEEAVQKVGDIQDITSKILEENRYELKSKSKLDKFLGFIFRAFNSKWRLPIFAILVFGFPIWAWVVIPIMVFIILIFVCIFAVPVLALYGAVNLLWDPWAYSNFFTISYFLGLSLILFGVVTFYISCLTTFSRASFKFLKKLSIKIKRLKYSKKAEK